MKKILGLDLGTNSIGWALVEQDFESKAGKILGMGSRIIPMSQDILGKFDSGQSISQTAERTSFRSIRRLRQRSLLRRERLHRVLNILGFLPDHYANSIDFDFRLGQFKDNKEPKIAYFLNDSGKFDFLFPDSFEEMVADFRRTQPHLFFKIRNGEEAKIPYDWTIYYLRKKALSKKIKKEELAWLLLHFNQKRGYFQLRGEEESVEENKSVKFHSLRVVKVEPGEKGKNNDVWYNVFLENGWIYRRSSKTYLDWAGSVKEFIVTEDLNSDGSIKTDKDGKEKRSFKAVDSEKDWIAIKKSTEEKILDSGKTVGTFIYDTLLKNPDQKIRGKLIRTVERKFYKKELRLILEAQKSLHTELGDKKLYRDCIEELYPFNDAHRTNLADRDFVHLFLEDIIFYQRPLKSKKGLISDCPFEYRVFKAESGELKRNPIKAIAKSNPLYQEFRLLQWLKNLRIYRKDPTGDVDITDELLKSRSDRVDLLEWLNDKAEISQEELLKYPFFALEEQVKEWLGNEGFKAYRKNKESGLIDFFRWNYVEDKIYPLNETRGGMIKALKKHKFPPELLTREKEEKLWHILYSVEDPKELERALKKLSLANGLPDGFTEAFRRYPRIEKDYGSFSAKALKKLLPLMRFGKFWSLNEFDNNTLSRIQKIIDGELDVKIQDRVREKAIHLKNIESFQNLPLWLASYIVYDRHAEMSDIQFWKKPDDIQLLKQHSLRNPIVEQVVNETLQTVKEIWKFFGEGKANFFDEIHVELGREMKNPADQRRRITERITENENTNNRIKALLAEMMDDGSVENVRPYSPSQQEMLKIFEEGIYDNERDQGIREEIEKIRKKNQPSSTDLKRYKLWLEQGYKSPYTGEMIPLSKLFTPAFEIEHIIPQSRFFDDSFSNKIICEAEVNSLKDNQLAYEFIKNNPGMKVELSWGKTVELLRPAEYEDNVKKYFAKNQAKKRKLLLEEIPEEFIERQMNDSRYISKVVKSLLSNIVREDGEQEGIAKNLLVSTGGITSRLKQDWGLNAIWNDLITPRFERLNLMAGYEKYGRWESKEGKNVFQVNTLEEELAGLNKKRIDHRHHALDALVVACSSRNHINYLNNDNANGKDRNKPLRYDLRNKLRKIEEVVAEKAVNGQTIRSKRQVAREFYKPWDTFTKDARENLQQVIVSFKKNTRVINKTVNYYQKWIEQPDGRHRKGFVAQTKGDHWAIRKPLHKDTVFGQLDLRGIKIPKNKILTATRKPIDASFDVKKIQSVTDTGIQKILLNYLEFKGGDPEIAFSPEGIDELNANIKRFNAGASHKPIKRARIFEVGGKFNLGYKGNKASKFVEAAKGTNLFFAVYVDKKGDRSFSTIPLNIVIERQKQGLSSCPPEDDGGNKLLFDLSPNDLVYVPSPEEQENPQLFDIKNLKPDQISRIYKFVSSSDKQAFFIQCTVSAVIVNKIEFSALNKMEKAVDGTMIKAVCWKLVLDRLGNVIEKITQ